MTAPACPHCGHDLYSLSGLWWCSRCRAGAAQHTHEPGYPAGGNDGTLRNDGMGHSTIHSDIFTARRDGRDRQDDTEDVMGILALFLIIFGILFGVLPALYVRWKAGL